VLRQHSQWPRWIKEDEIRIPATNRIREGETVSFRRKKECLGIDPINHEAPLALLSIKVITSWI
jgi:hypothetical protein